MSDRMHTPDWEELEMWIGSFDAPPNPASVVKAMQNSGWREPAYQITTIDELAELPVDAVVFWMDDAGLPHAHLPTQLLQSQTGPMWPMTVIRTGGDDE